jgi:hypothetical protein
LQTEPDVVKVNGGALPPACALRMPLQTVPQAEADAVSTRPGGRFTVKLADAVPVQVPAAPVNE